ncbi:SGNH/GDSL hydrolase family protein [Streptomyces stelliscabiei]|uniref:Lysophospholipase L1-like esterase n=1 Tax=Streptomyces stelliscabiei TaxID=146820 RepID=A0A8I0TW45_9ACTN|nr:SGNH/GDSL hydrolase family protein [Streptomyces stelliscabiei]KND42907.1 lysophospholipase [Streptomyces stelliscabiei]MBE1602434.1 lysophospholipase L1-like esterase [Streptomyces stelliscabiei]MDX2516659.1 SGNH/GDSL hydrolase family protein [Streptomyces stelliscabiei]
MTAPHPYLRYVAIGDSMTEGLGDPDPAGGHRGWADRLAEALAERRPGLSYANLAVRGRTAAQIRAEQLEPALELKPDLVTVMAGMNDLVRSGFDAASVVADIEEMFVRLTASGAQVATVNFPDLGKVSPLARRVLPRILDLNARLRATAERHGVLVLDVFAHPVTTDPRLWADDRLHASPLGHARIASGMAHTLGLPGHDGWAEPLPARPPVPALRAVGVEVRWAVDFLGPWLWRRLRGRSSGDGRSAKRPQPGPVTLPDTA